MNNIVIFATDESGGAGKAATRIMRAFNQYGKRCVVLVKTKDSDDKNVIEIYSRTKFPLHKRIGHYFNKKKVKNLVLDAKYYFGGRYDDIVYTDINSFIDFVPDTVIVTWISWFVSPGTIKKFASQFNARIIVYPMDMSLFTGGCHYAWDCLGFENSCSDCPAIISYKHKYIASNELLKKKASWSDDTTVFWACSSNVHLELKRASLCVKSNISDVFIPIDENVFKIGNKLSARNVFNINSSDKIILFGSSFSFEPRKGINFFIESLRLLYDMLSSKEKALVKVVIAGRKQGGEVNYTLPFDVVDIDFIKDDSLLANLYQAVDVLVCPSIQDSGPMMINEAQMCGLPVVSFNIGVAGDFIVDNFSGYVCSIGDVKQMAISIKNVLMLEQDFNRVDIANAAAKKTSFKSFINLSKNTSL